MRGFESIFRVAEENGIDLADLDRADVSRLELKEEINLIRMMLQYYAVLEGGARGFEPHRVAFYLLDLVGKFHSYYNKARVLGEDRDLTLARLLLLKILKAIIKDGLQVLGVSAPERM